MRAEEDFFGKHVAVAARLANSARGGEILVSTLVREIVDARGDLTFDEPRTVGLEGLARRADRPPCALATETHRAPLNR